MPVYPDYQETITQYNEARALYCAAEDPAVKAAHLRQTYSAMNNLGICYAFGAGVPKNRHHAVDHYWTPAANGGYDRAQNNLARSYETGKGVELNLRTAAYWYGQAAAQGHPQAQYKLGVYYSEGYGGLTKSPKKAIEWCRKAAKQEHPRAQYDLAMHYLHSPHHSNNEAVCWMKKAADHNHAEAQYELATLCSNNVGGMKRDLHFILKYYSAAAQQGHEGAAHWHNYFTDTLQTDQQKVQSLVTRQLRKDRAFYATNAQTIKNILGIFQDHHYIAPSELESDGRLKHFVATVRQVVTNYPTHSIIAKRIKQAETQTIHQHTPLPPVLNELITGYSAYTPDDYAREIVTRLRDSKALTPPEAPVWAKLITRFKVALPDKANSLILGFLGIGEDKAVHLRNAASAALTFNSSRQIDDLRSARYKPVETVTYTEELKSHASPEDGYYHEQVPHYDFHHRFSLQFTSRKSRKEVFSNPHNAEQFARLAQEKGVTIDGEAGNFLRNKFLGKWSIHIDYPKHPSDNFQILLTDVKSHLKQVLESKAPAEGRGR